MDGRNILVYDFMMNRTLRKQWMIPRWFSLNSATVGMCIVRLGVSAPCMCVSGTQRLVVPLLWGCVGVVCSRHANLVSRCGDELHKRNIGGMNPNLYFFSNMNYPSFLEKHVLSKVIFTVDIYWQLIKYQHHCMLIVWNVCPNVDRRYKKIVLELLFSWEDIALNSHFSSEI